MTTPSRPSPSSSNAPLVAANRSKAVKRNRTESTGNRRSLNIASANEKVWLVKVPKYLAQQWLSDQYGNEAIIAKLTCAVDQKTSKSRFRLRPMQPPPNSRSVASSSDSSVCFRDFEFHINPMRSNGPKMCIMQETFTPTPAPVKTEKKAQSSSSSQNRTSHLIGTVSAKVDCRPLQVDNSYMQRMRQEISNANKPKGEIICIENARPTFKPVSDHKYNIEQKAKQKVEGKNIRRAEEDVRSDLFSAFERHQYYKINDLVAITKQPVPHLRSILLEIADYSVKPPYRNMWQLKPEYRHYLSSQTYGGE